MRAVLDYCVGGHRRRVSAGAVVIHEGGTTGHLYVLIEGRLEVLKGDTVVASIAEPGAVLGEMSVLLDQPHTATVRAAADSTIYEFSGCSPSDSMSPTPISPTSSGNMPATAITSRGSATSCRA